MCGRYELFYTEENFEMNKIVELAVNNSPSSLSYTPGEIFPSTAAPIIAASGRKITPQFFVWGFPGFQKKELLINARSESAAQKPTFKSSFLQRRCVIPSTGFYEWSHDSLKKKYKFIFKLRICCFTFGISSLCCGSRAKSGIRSWAP